MNESWWTKQEELDESQLKLIDLPLDTNYVITGPPGSGKTNLLLLRANHYVNSGKPNVLVLVLTRTLRDFIAAGASKYSFAPSKVKTSIKWCEDLLTEAGVDFDRPNEYEQHRSSLFQKVHALIEAGEFNHSYDAVLLDEAQDYSPDEVALFAKCAQNVFSVSDHRQKIYKGKDCFDTLVGLPSTHRELKYHYRNGYKICQFADGIGKSIDASSRTMTPTCQYDEKKWPSSVELVESPDFKAQIARIAEALQVQLKAYPNELLGVICPTRADVAAMTLGLSSSEHEKNLIDMGRDGGITTFDSRRRICVTTFHSAKGLEFRGLHLAGLESLRKMPLNRNLMFMGATRAKTFLSLHHSGSIPGYIESGMAALQVTTPKPSIASAFGGATR